MSYVGSGSGQVTFQINDGPAQKETYSLNISETTSELSIVFTPRTGEVDPNKCPLVQILALNFNSEATNYVANTLGQGGDALVDAMFNYPSGPTYYSGTGCVGKVNLNWTVAGNQRTYTGFFYAYNMGGNGSPLSIKFSDFSFVTNGT